MHRHFEKVLDIASFRWFSIGPNSQRPNAPSGKCPNGRCPKEVARSQLPEQKSKKRNLPEFCEEYARNYTIITFQCKDFSIDFINMT
jgi:hypothetical protein